jgi:hypothetical protein
MNFELNDLSALIMVLSAAIGALSMPACLAFYCWLATKDGSVRPLKVYLGIISFPLVCFVFTFGLFIIRSITQGS